MGYIRNNVNVKTYKQKTKQHQKCWGVLGCECEKLYFLYAGQSRHDIIIEAILTGRSGRVREENAPDLGGKGYTGTTTAVQRRISLKTNIKSG